MLLRVLAAASRTLITVAATTDRRAAIMKDQVSANSTRSKEFINWLTVIVKVIVILKDRVIILAITTSITADIATVAMAATMMGACYTKDYSY